MAAALAKVEWHKQSTGGSGEGPRFYCWARTPPRYDTDGFECRLLVRRSRHDPTALVFTFAYAPRGTSPAEFAGGVGLRRAIEQAIQRTNDHLALGYWEACFWPRWHRHMSLRHGRSRLSR